MKATIKAEEWQSKGKAETGCSTGDEVSQGALLSRRKHKPVVLPTSPAAAATSSEEEFLHSGDDGASPFPIQRKRWTGKLMRSTREYDFIPKLVILQSKN